MFRELLERNGTVLNYEDLKTFYRGSISDIPYKFYRLKGKDEVVNNKVYNSVEEMYLDYCIENGVKLELLCQDVDGDYMKRILDDEWIDSATFSPATPLESWLEYHLSRIMPNSRKLIFAILGHDIRIIA